MSCDCNPIVVGEAGPQGSQGLAGLNGSNGTNGINAFTSTTANYTQPSVDASITISVGSSEWMAIGQYFYVEGAGYYLVTGKSSTTSVTATLKILETTGTITYPKKVTPSGNVSFNGSGASLSITGASSFNTSHAAVNTVISGDNDLYAVFVKGSNDRVGIGTNDPETKLQVIGDVKIGNTSTSGSLMVTNATTLNSKNTASIVPLDVIGSSSSTHLIYAESTSNTVVIGGSSPQAGKQLKVSGDTLMTGTLDTGGLARVNSLEVTNASSFNGSIGATTITASGAVSALSYQTATGSGAAKLTKFFYYAPADITLSSLADGDISSTEYTTGITGLLTTDFIQVSAQSSITDFYKKCIVSAAVSDTTKIAVTILNKTGGAISGTVSIKLLVTRAAAS
jgi:hypothetical protein